MKFLVVVTPPSIYHMFPRGICTISQILWIQHVSLTMFLRYLYQSPHVELTIFACVGKRKFLSKVAAVFMLSFEYTLPYTSQL